MINTTLENNSISDTYQSVLQLSLSGSSTVPTNVVYEGDNIIKDGYGNNSSLIVGSNGDNFLQNGNIIFPDKYSDGNVLLVEDTNNKKMIFSDRLSIDGDGNININNVIFSKNISANKGPIIVSINDNTVTLTTNDKVGKLLHNTSKIYKKILNYKVTTPNVNVSELLGDGYIITKMWITACTDAVLQKGQSISEYPTLSVSYNNITYPLYSNGNSVFIGAVTFTPEISVNVDEITFIGDFEQCIITQVLYRRDG